MRTYLCFSCTIFQPSSQHLVDDVEHEQESHVLQTSKKRDLSLELKVLNVNVRLGQRSLRCILVTMKRSILVEELLSLQSICTPPVESRKGLPLA